MTHGLIIQRVHRSQGKTMNAKRDEKTCSSCGAVVTNTEQELGYPSFSVTPSTNSSGYLPVVPSTDVAPTARGRAQSQVAWSGGTRFSMTESLSRAIDSVFLPVNRANLAGNHLRQHCFNVVPQPTNNEA